MGDSASKQIKKPSQILETLGENKQYQNLTQALSQKIEEWSENDTEEIHDFLRQREYCLTGEVLGTGSFGVVAKGINMKNQKEIAIKIVKFETREQFFNNLEEFNNHQKLIHPNVLLAMEIFNFNELRIQFIIMELCQTDLMSYLKSSAEKGKWPNKQNILNIWSQLVDGLHFLHMNGVLHFDIKPANILLGQDNKWKYTDFGLSHSLSNGEQSTQNPKGFTSIWCSSEQYYHHFLKIKQRISKESDIYSLGLVFLNMTQIILENKESIAVKLEDKKLDQHLNPHYSMFNSEVIKKMVRSDPMKRITLGEAKDIILKLSTRSSNLSSFASPINIQITADSNQEESRSKQFKSPSSLEGNLEVLFKKTNDKSNNNNPSFQQSVIHQSQNLPENLLPNSPEFISPLRKRRINLSSNPTELESSKLSQNQLKLKPIQTHKFSSEKQSPEIDNQSPFSLKQQQKLTTPSSFNIRHRQTTSSTQLTFLSKRNITGNDNNESLATGESTTYEENDNQHSSNRSIKLPTILSKKNQNILSIKTSPSERLPTSLKLIINEFSEDYLTKQQKQRKNLSIRPTDYDSIESLLTNLKSNHQSQKSFLSQNHIPSDRELQNNVNYNYSFLPNILGQKKNIKSTNSSQINSIFS